HTQHLQHQQTHHQHHLEGQPPPNKIQRTGPGSGSMSANTQIGAAGPTNSGMAGPSSMTGPTALGPPSGPSHPGMPPQAQRPRGPKVKFTPEDDTLLVDLKENKALTWKQIAEYFPGRTSGTLQVRYCTKLKAKTTQWTDETVSKFGACLGAARSFC